MNALLEVYPREATREPLILPLAQCNKSGASRVYLCRIKQRNRRIRLTNEQPDFRATENHALSAALRQTIDDAEICRTRIIAHLPATQLVEDHAIHELLVLLARREHTNAPRLAEAC